MANRVKRATYRLNEELNKHIEELCKKKDPFNNEVVTEIRGYI
ncbi:unnamed protein product, partial [marine sediment metagenome]